ncbi:MAG: regulatory protein, FmdB family [Deltaproteobacteria bacterium]|nr:regulatory protein, FmdB family [Deltaproteobacteria bacterium]
MPIYEYRCRKCDEVTERIEGFHDDPLKKCPSCAGKVERLMSAGAFILKGTGWYARLREQEPRQRERQGERKREREAEGERRRGDVLPGLDGNRAGPRLRRMSQARLNVLLLPGFRQVPALPLPAELV